MSRKSRIARAATLLAVGGALLIPSYSAVAGDGPVATKSGPIINYTSTAKLKIGKKINIYFSCLVNCNVTSNTKIKGPGGKLVLPPLSGSFAAGTPGFVEITPNGPLLKAM